MHVESLGRFIDNLMGDARVRRRVRRKLDPITLRPDEMPDDPPLPVPPFVVTPEDDLETEGAGVQRAPGQGPREASGQG